MRLPGAFFELDRVSREIESLALTDPKRRALDRSISAARALDEIINLK